MPADTTPRLSCPLEQIDVSGLLRKDLGNIKELEDSISENLSKGLPGLIHPIVVDGSMKLISGFRRWNAHKNLGLKEIDYQFYAVLDEAERTRLEIEANYQKGFTWQERCLGIVRYHNFYRNQAALKGESWGVRETGKLLRTSKSPVGRAILISEYLQANDPDVWKADTMEDAFRVLIAREEAAQAKLLVSQTIPTKPAAQPVKHSTQDLLDSLDGKKPEAAVDDKDFFTPSVHGGFTPGVVGGPITTDERPGAPRQRTVVPLSSMCLKSTGPRDMSILDGLGSSCTDHIICDPPFGVADHMDMIDQQNMGSDMSSVRNEHVEEETMKMMADFRPLAFRALRDKGFLIMWCDPTHWWDECNLLTALGFSVQRWPLIWNKTSSCSNGQAYKNFTKNCEFAVVARKGDARLATTQASCIWTGSNDSETKLLGHKFAKPFGLWKWVYEAVCLRGQEVLDPFVGKGSAMIPAIQLGLRPRGIECNEDHYNGLILNVSNFYKSLDPQVEFS